MLRSNLSTRPFYNERAVHLLIVGAAALVLAFTAFNVFRVVVLSRENTELTMRAESEESRARQLRAAAQRTRQTLDMQVLETISSSAREANAIIDRRLFSWTELFNFFEIALPDDVRITSVRPQTDRSGAVKLVMTVIGRRFENVSRFMDGLEATHAFRNVLSIDERVEDGNLLAVIEAQYVAGRPGAIVPPAAAPAGKTAGGTTP